jgi:hypothetical protein
MTDKQDEDPEAKKPKITQSTFFDTDLLQQKLERHFRRIETEKTAPKLLPLSQTSHLYDIDDGFAPDDLYWTENAQKSPFKDSFERGILYRPKIVEELVTEVETLLSDRFPGGVMVKGPQGIGKSHSLVNLVRKLLYNSNGKYLVTFIQNCQSFKDVSDLYESICKSFGTSTKELQFPMPKPPEAEYYKVFVAAIELFLEKKDKQWVLIFDQINRLFIDQEAKDVGRLRFPFSAISSTMKTGRVTSIISASANNEATYRVNHDGFEEYEHCLAMTSKEVSDAFPSSNTNDVLSPDQLDTIMEVTGGVPLQVQNLISFGCDVEVYFNYESLNISGSLIKLLNESSKKISQVSDQITSSAVSCAMAWPTAKTNYFDRKYSVYRKTDKGYDGGYEPVYPLALVVYRNFFWDDIMKYVNDKEQDYLQICEDSRTTNDVRGRIFEWIVIIRYQSTAAGVKNKLTIGGQSFDMPQSNLVRQFGSQKLPSELRQNGLYIPWNCNFPAIDFILKHDRIVWGVQVHVAAHLVELKKFQTMCEEARWHLQFDKIYLLYVSPEPSIMKHVIKKQLPFKDHDGVVKVEVRFASKDDLTCLESLQWPAECSFKPKQPKKRKKKPRN